jgi:hypothetical protein
MAIRTPKQAARERRAAWQQAVEEARVLRFGEDGLRFIAYPTIAARDAALAEAAAAGLAAAIVKAAPAPAPPGPAPGPRLEACPSCGAGAERRPTGLARHREPSGRRWCIIWWGAEAR